MKEILVLLKRSIEDEEELEEQMLSDMERGTSNPHSRRKQKSMGERESKPTTHNFPGSSTRREMWEKKQGERDWEKWGRRVAEEKAIAGKDLPSFHGFGSDRLREIHPGDSGSDIPPSGKYEFDGIGREERLIPFEPDVDDLIEWLQPGNNDITQFFNESYNPKRFDNRSNEPVWQPKPWTTSGPRNFIPETQEWVDNIITDNPTFHGIPFNEETGFTKGYNKELKYTPDSVGAFSEAWDVLKMGFPPSSGPSPLPTLNKPPNGGALNGNGTEEYSHKDLDGESLIDFLIQTLEMDYQDAKVLVNHHKTKEMASASQRKAKVAAEEALEGGAPPMPPPQPPMGGPPMGQVMPGQMGKPPMGLGGPI